MLHLLPWNWVCFADEGKMSKNKKKNKKKKRMSKEEEEN